MADLYGADVSQFQGTIDWDALNAASNFVIIRATYGTITDPEFARNQSEARRVQASAGPLGIGYYSYVYPTLLDSQTSANYFTSVVGPLNPGEVLACDLEGNIGPDPVGWALAFLQAVEAITGVKPLIYLNQSEVNGYSWGSVINAGFGLWLADYNGAKTDPAPATPWPVVAMRQWASTDQVAGITGNVDGDTFYGDFDQFNAYGYKSPQPPTPAPPVQPPAPPTPTPAPTPTTPPTPPAPQPASPKPQPVNNKENSPMNTFFKWLGTTFGGAVTTLVTTYLGFLAANVNNAHLNATATSLVGAIAGIAIKDFNNPGTPNTTQTK